MTPSNLPEPSDRRSIMISYLCTVLLWGAVYIYMPILAPYSKMVSGSLQSVGLVMGAYGLSQLILRIPLGVGSDRWRRRKPFVLLGFLFDGLASLGLLLANSTGLLFLSVFTAGIAASMWVPSIVLFSSYFPLGQVAHSMSLLLFFHRLSQVIANYAGGAIAEAWGWVAPFYVGMVLSLIGFLLATRLTERRPEKGPATSFRQLLLVGRNPVLLVASITCAIVQFTNFSTNYGFTPIFAQQIGASKGELGILLVCFTLPNTLATLLSGTTLRRLFSDRSIIFIGLLLISGAILSIPLVGRLWILFAVQAINGIGVGLAFPLLMGLSIQSTPREQQATAMGLFQWVYAIGMTLGPIISGVFAERMGLSSVFILNGLLGLAGAFFSFRKLYPAHPIC
jgi:DHA1 family multidrug resistance protein-like MFS transporter